MDAMDGFVGSADVAGGLDHLEHGFKCSALFFGGVTLVAGLAVRRDWASRQRVHPAGFSEISPPWAYDASAKITLAWSPIALLLVLQGMMVSYSLTEYFNKREILDVVVFGGMFGVMVKDFLLCFSTPDYLLLAHHLVVMGIAWAISLLPNVQLARLCTLTAILAEMGSACYCYHIIHCTPRLYKIGMTLSNIVLATAVFYAALLNYPALPFSSVTLGCAGVSVAIGRQAVMFLLMRKEDDGSCRVKAQ